MKSSRHVRRFAPPAATAALALLIGTCSAPPGEPERTLRTWVREPSAWDTVYEVLLHPRCANCHPAGDVPLQGDDGHPHAQNVRRGPDGHGLFAMRCETCHQTRNLAGPHLPPGAPSWHLPGPDMPLVFVGRSKSDLCRQLRDPARNGGKTPEELFSHLAEDPLVLWGWDPGEGRAPVPVPHAEFVAAVRAWIDGGCECPEE